MLYLTKYLITKYKSCKINRNAFEIFKISFLKDQLHFHMNLYLNENIFYDLKNGILFLPCLLLDNIYLFNPANMQKTRIPQENMMNFLLENLSKEPKENLKHLMDSYSATYGENIDEYGVKELAFKIVNLHESKRFLIKLDYSNSNDHEGM